MSQTNIATAFLSLTAPGAEIVLGAAQIKLARDVNKYAASIRDADSQRFGFFAALPSLLNVPAALEEIRYAMDVLHADGVTLFTRYGDKHDYLGHDGFRPIWEELNGRKAVVFIHPTHPVDTNLANKQLPQPAIDYRHETTRCAFDLILSGTKHAFPDCKIILSHGGGTLPFLLTRAAQLVPRLPPNFGKPIPAEQIVEDAKSFYFDLALSSSPEILDTLLKYFPHERILFGSDMPYAQEGAVLAFNEMLDEYPLGDELRRKIAFENSWALFPRLKDAST
jgi:predicted TIM-barrel fold metal-dependent hydrolase